MGIPGVGMGMPRGGGGGGGPRAVESSQGGVAAYKLYPHSAVYKLDGSETTVQLGDPEQTGATSKVAQEKKGAESRQDSDKRAVEIFRRWEIPEG